jgi:N-acetylmuramoyl-L-alanine amidase
MFYRPSQNRSDRSLSLGQGIVAVFCLAGAVLLTSPASAGNKFVEEVTCLALNIYFEARNQPAEGKIAVGHVVMNRVANPKFPKSVCKVVQQGGERRRHRCQFSWWCDGQSDRPRNQHAWNESIHIAKKIYIGFSADPTQGALWYHAEYVRPYWRKVMKPVRKIGTHIFYLNGKSARKVAASYDG